MPQKYIGSCHCGAVAFETELDTASCITCNCSMCGRAGTVLSFVPENAFHLQKGADELTDYLFHKEHIHHVFCQTCGIKPFAYAKGENGETTYAVNLRCLENLDIDSLTPQKVDGKSY